MFERLRLRPFVFVLLLACAALAACDTFDQKKRDQVKIDPNLFPTDYKSKIVLFLKTYLTERGSYAGAAISTPLLRPFGSENRYVACVRILNGAQAGEKAAVFFGGQLNQFVDAEPGTCSGAAYEPFRELETSR